jgi:hypothetical protein
VNEGPPRRDSHHGQGRGRVPRGRRAHGRLRAGRGPERGLEDVRRRDRRRASAAHVHGRALQARRLSRPPPEPRARGAHRRHRARRARRARAPRRGFDQLPRRRPSRRGRPRRPAAGRPRRRRARRRRRERRRPALLLRRRLRERRVGGRALHVRRPHPRRRVRLRDHALERPRPDVRGERLRLRPQARRPARPLRPLRGGRRRPAPRLRRAERVWLPGRSVALRLRRVRVDARGRRRGERRAPARAHGPLRVRLRRRHVRLRRQGRAAREGRAEDLQRPLRLRPEPAGVARHRHAVAPARGRGRVRHDERQRRAVRFEPLGHDDGDARVVPPAERQGGAEVDAGAPVGAPAEPEDGLRLRRPRRQLDHPRRAGATARRRFRRRVRVPLPDRGVGEVRPGERHRPEVSALRVRGGRRAGSAARRAGGDLRVEERRGLSRGRRRLGAASRRRRGGRRAVHRHRPGLVPDVPRARRDEAARGGGGVRV